MGIIEEVKNNIGINGSLILGDAVNIIKTAKGYLNSSSETSSIKRYASILKTAVGDSPGGFASKYNTASSGLKRADAMATYYTLVTEGGKDPKEAYKEVAEMYARTLNEDMNFIAPTSGLFKIVGKSKIDTWTKDDIQKARDFVKENPINSSTSKRTYSPIELVIEKETIDLIENYQIEKDNFKKQTTGIPNDKETQNGGSNVIDSILKIFGSSEEENLKNPK